MIELEMFLGAQNPQFTLLSSDESSGGSRWRSSYIWGVVGAAGFVAAGGILYAVRTKKKPFGAAIEGKIRTGGVFSAEKRGLVGTADIENNSLGKPLLEESDVN
jgi:hypothetical protein